MNHHWNRDEVTKNVATLLPSFRQRMGDRVVTSMVTRQQHNGTEGMPMPGCPDAVLFPADLDELCFIAKAGSDAHVPMIPFGTGTSLEGHVAAVHGGLCVDVSNMNRVLEVSADSMDCLVQAGTTRLALNEATKDAGLFFPIDPGANASLGGMAATRASGTAAVRYGTMRDAVLGLTIVTPDGRVVRTGSRARKSAAGLDLTRLYIGSEGVLGFIAELRLRLWGLPEEIRAAVCQFPTLESAVRTVIGILQTSVPMARMELLDEVQVAACIAYSQLQDMEVKPTLFFEFHGGPASVAEQIGTVEALASEYGGSGFKWAERPEDRSKLWKARHQATQANLALRPGCRLVSTDACVPIGSLVECILETKADVLSSGLIAPLVGHVGDGNFHLGIVFDPDDVGEQHRAEALAERVAMRAIRYGGTCTGEHGIGAHRKHQLVAEHEDGVRLMRQLKSALDPCGVMNPGKLFNP